MKGGNPLRIRPKKISRRALIKNTPGQTLFDVSNDTFTNVINARIAETLKAAGFKPMKVEDDGTERWKTLYTLRHRMHNKAPDNAVGRYVTGHAAKDIHERYIKIDPVELPEDYQAVIDAVEGVPDPTAEAVELARNADPTRSIVDARSADPIAI